MAAYKRMDQDNLITIWMKAAKAKASQMRGEGNLYAAFAAFATDGSLDEDAFTQRTKALEETLVRNATGEALKAAVRSSSSSSRCVIASALDQGRTVVRQGKPVGKSRLEAEKKACVAGHAASSVMEADSDALKSMAAVPTEEASMDKAMSLADGLKALCANADDALLADIAHEILGADIRLAAAIRFQCEQAVAA